MEPLCGFVACRPKSLQDAFRPASSLCLQIEQFPKRGRQYELSKQPEQTSPSITSHELGFVVIFHLGSFNLHSNYMQLGAILLSSVFPCSRWET